MQVDRFPCSMAYFQARGIAAKKKKSKSDRQRASKGRVSLQYSATYISNILTVMEGDCSVGLGLLETQKQWKRAAALQTSSVGRIYPSNKAVLLSIWNIGVQLSLSVTFRSFAQGLSFLSLHAPSTTTLRLNCWQVNSNLFPNIFWIAGVARSHTRADQTPSLGLTDTAKTLGLEIGRVIVVVKKRGNVHWLSSCHQQSWVWLSDSCVDALLTSLYKSKSVFFFFYLSCITSQ